MNDNIGLKNKFLQIQSSQSRNRNICEYKYLGSTSGIPIDKHPNYN